MTSSNNHTNDLPLFRLGFRPFFLVAAFASVALLCLWLLGWANVISVANYYSPITWHAHEMLFGYSTAVIAGFLLTAVRNWTGIDTPSGVPLMVITLIWLAARLFPFIPLIPGWLIMITDLAFLPLVAIALVRPLWLGKNKVNRIFLLLLTVMLAANMMVHAEALGLAQLASQGLTLMTDMIVLLILIITGRVLPFFTQAVIPGFKAKQWAWVERSTILLMTLITILHQLPTPDWLVSIAYFILAGLQVIRVLGWHNPRVWKIPVLWVLYTGYAWLIVGFVLSALTVAVLFPANLATHALTIGVIGIFTLGMMSRVALGHTGRQMKTSASVNMAFILLNLSAVARVFGPVILPAQYTAWIYLSGSIWILAFLLFAIQYTPILINPRVDGKPG